MPSILPFSAYRAAPEQIEAFSASAYDSELRTEDLSAQAGHPVSYLRILFPSLFHDAKISREEELCRSQDVFKEYREDGTLKADEGKSFYLYRQIHENHVFTGLICVVPNVHYSEGRIKKHELTRTEKESQMATYFHHIRLNGSPVLLTHPDHPDLQSLYLKEVEKQPVYHFVSGDGLEHFLWRIDEPGEVEAFQSVYESIHDFYIADGHHRCAAHALLDEEVEGFMACLIPASQIVIKPFHRLIKTLGGMKHEQLLATLRERFELHPLHSASVPAIAGRIHLLFKGEGYCLTLPESLREQETEGREKLDVSLLEKHILQPIIGIADSRTDRRIQFLSETGTLPRIRTLLETGEAEAAFILHPIEAEEMIRISDEEETMPPKSTWIEPKLRSGLLIHKF